MQNIASTDLKYKDPERRNLHQEETRTTKKTLENRRGGGPQEDEYSRVAIEDTRSTGLEEDCVGGKVHTGL